MMLDSQSVSQLAWCHFKHKTLFTLGVFVVSDMHANDCTHVAFS